MEDLNKKATVLDDDALIYATGSDRVDAKSEKENWANLDKAGKWQYFKDYYLLKTIIGIAVVVLVGAIVWSIVKPRASTLAGIFILDSVLDSEEIDTYFDNMVTEQGLTTKDYTYDVRDTYSSTSSSDITAVSTILYSGDIDIIIATSSVIDGYAQNDILCDLTNLPDDIKAALSEEDYYYASIKETDEYGNTIDGGRETQKLVGIHLKDSSFMKATDTDGYGTDYIFCMLNGSNTDNALNALRGILGIPMEQSTTESD